MAAIAGTHVFGVVSFHLREGEMPFASSSLSRKRIGDCSQRNVVLRRRGNTAILPIISAQNIPGTNARLLYDSFHYYCYLICCLNCSLSQTMFQNPSSIKLKPFSGYKNRSLLCGLERERFTV